MKITIKKTVTEIKTYHLTDEVKYDITYVNGKLKTKELKYTGKKLYNYDLKPLYDKDLSILKQWNPCWGDNPEYDKKYGYDFLSNTNLPDPEDMDVSKIIYLQFASHAFFTLDKDPIPVVIEGNYIEAKLNNYWYDLPKLKEYLSKHPNIVKCSEILDIPYYNSDRNTNKYLDVLVYPTKEILQKAYDNKSSKKDYIFYIPYDEKSIDFLGIKQFAIKNKYE